MIRETLSRRSHPAVTSDRWHVVHARWSGESTVKARFARSIVSEHEDRITATNAARKFMSSLVDEMATREPATRDQIFVRQPAFCSLKTARRFHRRRK